jgi:hypothetical protein
MSKPKHTRGPWEVCDDGVSVHAPNEQVIVATYQQRGEDNQPDFTVQTQEELEANARLIAAAPDLMASVAALLPLAQEYLKSAPSHPDNAKIADAIDAVAKARGERG